MSYYGGTQIVFLTKDVSSCFFFNITLEEHWYKLKCNSKILGLMSGLHKKGTVFDLTRHGCIESLDGRAVRLDDICQFGSLNLVKRVIFNDDPDWNTALRGACLGGHIDIVKFALDKGADYLDLELRYRYRRVND